MTDWLKNWLMGVTCTAMFLALAESVVPNGTVKKVCRLAGGLAMLLAVVSPVVRLDGGAVADALAGYRREAASYRETLAEQNDELYRSIISERAAAYIVDKAAEVDISCQAEVTIGYDDNGTLCPWEVTARGKWTPLARETVGRILADDLGIPAERQHFEESLP